jgi:NADH-quinone oxidoreductase subunit I
MAVIRPFVIGFATTLRHLFRKPITVNYPEEKFPMFPKYRGKQVLMRDENGLEKCVACGLCSAACPADAIYLEAAENDGTVQAGPRYASIYQIHKTRCIFCGYCEEACPVGAIFMGKDYELAVYSKADFVWDKQDMGVFDAAGRLKWSRDSGLGIRHVGCSDQSLTPNPQSLHRCR